MELEKVTKGDKRRYDDACGTAHALDLIGERWALLVMRELMLGPKRFGDIRAGLPGISANVLTQRLEGLEAANVLTRRRLPPPASAQVYELTPWGYEAEVILQVMGRWAARSPQHDPTMPLSATSLFLSFRTMLKRDLAQGIDAKIGFRIGVEDFLAHLHDAEIGVRRGTLDGAEVIFAMPEAPVMAGVVYGGQPIEAMEAAGLLTVTGDRKLAADFITLFELPPKAVITA
ncbi:winged helix-turn-helix transcriptional regulator [Sphingoaurantiacus capsulatus]|uniref:Winged helix-turn-helix transcriptional regulator n=1 Tax=Sphingoaurantiacus capsulatus TaxID=1771310 RepID=A0ABV7XBE7_9SPHN